MNELICRVHNTFEEEQVIPEKDAYRFIEKQYNNIYIVTEESIWLSGKCCWCKLPNYDIIWIKILYHAI